MRNPVMIFGGSTAMAVISFAAVFATFAWQRSGLDHAASPAMALQQGSDEIIPAVRADVAPDRVGRLARYLAWVRVEKEKASFGVVVMQRDGKWLAHNYRVEPGQKLAAR